MLTNLEGVKWHNCSHKSVQIYILNAVPSTYILILTVKQFIIRENGYLKRHKDHEPVK